MNIQHKETKHTKSNPQKKGMGEALHLLGHNIIPFPYRLLQEKWGIESMNHQLMDIISRPNFIDVALIVKGDSIKPSVFNAIRAKNIFVVYWNMEATVNLQKEEQTRCRAN